MFNNRDSYLAISWQKYATIHFYLFFFYTFYVQSREIPKTKAVAGGARKQSRLCFSVDSCFLALWL